MTTKTTSSRVNATTRDATRPLRRDEGLKTCAAYWALRNGERAEDLAWMAEHGESAVGAAERLGISYDALEKWAKRNAPETWALLWPRNPRDVNGRTAGKNQWSAA